jgi:hypothetical protein
MRRTVRGLPMLAAAFLLGSCGTSSGDPPGETLALPAQDRDVAARLYAGTPRTPPGFAADPAPQSFAQVTTYHLKSSHVGFAAAVPFELCTDDWSEAFGWSETVAAQASPYLDFVANETTPSYFELDRVPRGQPDRYVRMRVFRCAYLERTGVDATAANGPAGVLNARPIDAMALRDVSEYLWLFSAYNNAGHVVLASESSALAHTITIASLERASDTSACDRVVVRLWSHVADAATGALVLATETMREFLVRRAGESIAGC